jgi:HD-like signal output (HDOD) protein/prolyl-tRNA editing enzyme YbaK/EbsC (Cys-tRNA(Pro) deacylase)
MARPMAEPENNDLPFLVKQHLRKHSIAHEVGANGSKGIRAEVALLKDTFGLVQVFFRSDTLLDLEKVKRLTGRQLQPLTLAEINKVKHKLSVRTLPAFDDLMEAETLIDERLFELHEIFVYSGSMNHLIRLADTQLLKQKDATRVADLCVLLPVAHLEQEPELFERDKAIIDHSINSFTALRIRKRIEETLEIPTLPATAMAIIKLRVDPDADISKLSRIVENDPSLAAQVVSWASSSYYAAPGSIKSVQDAIVRVLGYDLVMNLSLGLALGKTLDLPNDNPEGFAPYWTRAVYTAAASGALLSLIPREFRPGFGLIYLTGLLHNFGYLILAHAFRPHFSTVCRTREANRHLPHQLIEHHLLGITGDQIAASLMKSWQMPSEVCLGIRFQAEPDYLGNGSDHAQMVYLASNLLQQYGLLPGENTPLDTSVYDHLHINPQDVGEIMETLVASKDQIETIIKGLES